jgi:hypothetical protein
MIQNSDAKWTYQPSARECSLSKKTTKVDLKIVVVQVDEEKCRKCSTSEGLYTYGG